MVEVNGKRLEVVVPAGLGAVNGGRAAGAGRKTAGRAGRRRAAAKAPSGNALTSPMQGTIVKVAVADGDVVEAGDLVVVLEAMKMEQPLTAHRAGTITGLTAAGRRHGDQRVDPLRDRRLSVLIASCSLRG